jgi:hypothetical protein
MFHAAGAPVILLLADADDLLAQARRLQQEAVGGGSKLELRNPAPR